MFSEKILFEKKKELRGWYFVEYSPPVDDSFRFALVYLTILENVAKGQIAEAMESEGRLWLSRYPIPVMVSAFDSKEDAIHLEPVKPNSDLLATLSEPEGVRLHWGSFRNEELPSNALDRNYLLKIYHDIPSRRWTADDVKRVEKQQKRTAVTAWSILFVWLIIVPLAVIILGETSAWVGRMVLAYSVWQVLVQLLKLTGRWKKSSREEEQEQEEREMDHHHYHCKKNPEAFLRLKIENYEKEARERVQKEAEALKKAQKNN